MDNHFETDKFPFVKARHFRHVEGKRAVRLVVIHDMEFPRTASAAEVIAKDFATTSEVKSAHVCVDTDSIVQCVLDNDVAFAAPGANSDGIQIELAGFAKLTRKEWLSPEGVLVLNMGANAAAQYCLKYDIPVKHLTNKELADKKNRGLIGHVQATQVFGPKGGHTDPGPGFPWDFFLERVQKHLEARAAKLGKVQIGSMAGTPAVPSPEPAGANA
ncbi:MAG TPA: N-acetylmuramoyl-L-alanine amidase [Longimicrobium sp.]|nr:N-acetylmuramoyl-L-alanine amidase [Longimicrobium sp.]